MTFKRIVSYSTISNIELNIEIFSRMIRQSMNTMYSTWRHLHAWQHSIPKEPN